MMSYQGRVLASGAPFNGTGYFKFAIVSTGIITSFWSNNGSSSAGSEPTAAVPVTVSNGLFTVLLGDTTLGGMTQPLSATVFANADRRLRIWFRSTNAGAFTPLLPDQPLTTAPFAFNAQALGGLDASTFVQQSDLAASGFVTRSLADARYARISPTTQQIALLKWYTAISGTQADFGVGVNPHGIAFDGANMWVVNYGSNSVSVLRASDGFHVMTPTVGTGPDCHRLRRRVHVGGEPGQQQREQAVGRRRGRCCLVQEAAPPRSPLPRPVPRIPQNRHKKSGPGITPGPCLTARGNGPSGWVISASERRWGSHGHGVL